jgi:predicted DNA-binding transcriptional regulator YafY
VRETSSRLLTLLSVLQARPRWTAAELADRLDVTERTVRRDVARLRQLGYPVEADAGPHGGYRLGRGGRLPPLLLDDGEAVAVAVGLRAAADGSVSGLDDATVSALAKIEQVLPAHLAERVRSVHAATDELRGRDPDRVDAAVLVELASASRAGGRLRLAYADREGRQTERRVDPYRLVRHGPRWYLVAHDVDRQAWRTLRVDRIVAATRLPGVGDLDRLAAAGGLPDPVALVGRAMAVGPYPLTARLRLPVAAAEALAVVPRSVGVHTPDGDHTIVEVGGRPLDGMAGYVLGLAVPAEVLGPPELRRAVRARAAAVVAANAGDRSPAAGAGPPAAGTGLPVAGAGPPAVGTGPRAAGTGADLTG